MTKIKLDIEADEDISRIIIDIKGSNGQTVNLIKKEEPVKVQPSVKKGLDPNWMDVVNS